MEIENLLNINDYENKIHIFLFVILLSNDSEVLGQIGNNPKNDFKIGIYSPMVMTNNNDCCDTNNYTISEPYYNPYSDGRLFPTSHLESASFFLDRENIYW